jgi:hypothetical protein
MLSALTRLARLVQEYVRDAEAKFAAFGGAMVRDALAAGRRLQVIGARGLARPPAARALPPAEGDAPAPAADAFLPGRSDVLHDVAALAAALRLRNWGDVPLLLAPGVAEARGELGALAIPTPPNLGLGPSVMFTSRPCAHALVCALERNA